jgi:hypothetical protein
MALVAGEEMRYDAAASFSQFRPISADFRRVSL